MRMIERQLKQFLEVVEGDVLSSASVRAAMGGVSSAYYLVHSMGSTQHHCDRCDCGDSILHASLFAY